MVASRAGRAGTAIAVSVTEAVLLLAFNRPGYLRQVIDRLREVRPPRVYLAVDGPRPHRAGEQAAVVECRDMTSTLDWGCEVHTLFQQRNLGCGLGVSTAVSWFFEHEERGIILEDDILADPSFFPFCTELLDRYAEDPRVLAISGCNFVPLQAHGERGAYRFSRIPHIWGWATWRRAWALHRLDIGDWRTRLPVRDLWRASDRSASEALYWATTFELISRGEIDTWDGQLVLTAMTGGGLTATSNVNLVENIGFGADATHTQRRPDYLRPVEPIMLPTEPVPVRADRSADAWTRAHVFGATARGMAGQGALYLRRRRRRVS